MPDEHAPALRIDGLRFRYGGSGPWIVDLPELHLDAAEQVLLTGTSGSGKSTLLQLIAGLLDPAQGSVEVAGTNIHALRGAKRDLFRGRSIGMVFQTFHLLDGFSAAENVMAAMLFSNMPKREHRPRALELLKRLGIDRPNAPAREMSVGQQQRIAVARALACRPALVLADEPTASLDPENGAGAVALLRETCAEHSAALLCVSHDPAMAEHFDRRERLLPPTAGRPEAAEAVSAKGAGA